MKCIICRKNYADVNRLSDEHVIPDSLGGYYHIYNVCDECNKRMGDIIDPQLISHKIMEFCRFLNNIKSRNGYLPNPFGGSWNIKDEDDLKVQIFLNEDKDIDYKLIPSGIKRLDTNRYRLIVDKRDENIINKILDRFCKKNNLDKNLIEIKRTSEKTRPCIECKWEIDTVKFKIGLLKIAYEFAMNVLPRYIDDTESFIIANILRTGKINTIENCTRFIGSGMNEKAVQCMNFMRNLDDKHHHLMLISIRNVGLQCYINLFNAMFIGVWLSNTYYDIPGEVIIGINDISKKNFSLMNIDDYIKENYTRPQIQLYTKNNQEVKDFAIMPNGAIPLYYKSGHIAVKDIKELSKKHFKVKDLGDMKEFVETKVNIQKGIYYFKDKDNTMHLLKYYIVKQSKITESIQDDITDKGRNNLK